MKKEYISPALTTVKLANCTLLAGSGDYDPSDVGFSGQDAPEVDPSNAY